MWKESRDISNPKSYVIHSEDQVTLRCHSHWGLASTVTSVSHVAQEGGEEDEIIDYEVGGMSATDSIRELGCFKIQVI